MNQRIPLFIAFSVMVLAVSSCCTPKNKHAYMRKAYKKLNRSVKTAQVTNLDDTIKVLFPCNLMFPFNSTSIDSALLPSMNKFAKVLNKFDRTAVLVSGYTDSIGADDYNNNLSAQRADTAKNKLMLYNVANDRIKTWGMGKRHPVATNQTEEGRALNRRVEFIILYQESKK